MLFEFRCTACKEDRKGFARHARNRLDHLLCMQRSLLETLLVTCKKDRKTSSGPVRYGANHMVILSGSIFFRRRFTPWSVACDTKKHIRS